MKRCLYYFTLILLILNASNISALTYSKTDIGQDISWPNCNNLKFTPLSFGIVGVNGGLSFSANPCLGTESTLYRQNLSLYINTGFPGAPYDLRFQSWPLNCQISNTYCLAYNYGFNAGEYAINYELSRGVVSNNWWLDVESINSWSTNPNLNKNSLIGEFNAINVSVKPNTIGYYSNLSDWESITGGWQNKSVSWVATNSNYKIMAENECKRINFNGGKTLLTQYIGTTDLDLAC